MKALHRFFARRLARHGARQRAAQTRSLRLAVARRIRSELGLPDDHRLGAAEG